MKVIITCDHAGFEMANQIKEYLEKNNHTVLNYIPECYDGLDNYAINTKIPKKLLAKGKADRAIFLCGSGVGVSISANRQKGVRAIIGKTEKEVALARKHNNINCLCLGARFITLDKAIKLIEVFFNTEFEGGRHIERIKMLDK